MKRCLIAALAMVLSLTWLAGCGAEQISSEGQGSVSSSAAQEELIPAFDTPILVYSDGVYVEPYPHLYWIHQWSGDGWVVADMASLYDVLSTVGETLPELTYGADFEVFYQENVSFVSLSLYGEDCEYLSRGGILTDLEALEPGIYYLGIVVKEQGDYIESEGEYESNGYECVYRLIR